MLDFLMISTRSQKRGVVEIYPKFVIKKSSDLMIRGGDFYAIWVEERGLWSTDEQDALMLIDSELDKYAEENRHKFEDNVRVLHMWDSENGTIDRWHRYCQKHMRDNFHMLDEKLVFSNTGVNKNDYSSKRLSYPLEKGTIDNFDRLMSILYSDEERLKIEWAIGAIVSGDSKKIQKFLVFYGSAGTGKSTVLNVIQKLFEGYYSVFDAKALGSSNSSFALESFRTNPLVAIQHDGDLSKIEDNTRLNSLVSHEMMTVNEKFKSTYANEFKSFLFMGTNKPVKITDAKSGLIRRLIDVTPSGNKLTVREYKIVTKNINFELGAIAQHCLDVYLDFPDRYDNYIPISMLGASNDFYNFIEDSFLELKKSDGVSLTIAWEKYKTYCDEAKVPYQLSKRVFREELKNYFHDFYDRYTTEDGSRVRSYYCGFLTEKFETEEKPVKKKEELTSDWLCFDNVESAFDDLCCDCLAQYANSKETPKRAWETVKTKLSSIDTTKIHYVKVPTNHIIIDFDITDENGNKSLQKNVEEANKWPKTYAELSKSGQGIHLHYIYTGNAELLQRLYKEHIEVKVFTGKSALRRKLTKCNNLDIARMNPNPELKTKGEKVIDFDGVKNEKMLRSMIKKNLAKEYHSSTKSSVDYINNLLNDAYNRGIKYDLTEMRNSVLVFAANSTNQSSLCIKMVNQMPFKSKEDPDNVDNLEAPIAFYDVEVFKNLFLVNWKISGEKNKVIRMINPSPEKIEELVRKFRLIGFNCRRYDNHIMYARMLGYSNEELYRLSKKIINGDRNAFFGNAYNLSYTDVYDFASAANKKSLKKFEIELGIHHQELGLSWDEPVPEELWTKVAEYCDNDVVATEAVFEHLEGDWTARQILADLAEMSVNDTTNSLTTRIMFGNERNPQSQFKYRNLANPFYDVDEEMYSFLSKASPEMMSETHGEAGSILPYFEGYEFDHGKSTYRGETVGEGGYVYAETGMYGNVALLDVASMHPHSVIAECLFGVLFTQRFKDVVDGRICIKHSEWGEINNMLGGKLTKHVQRIKDGDITSKGLANALKTAINAVYGLTSASFDNAFRDRRNVDNIVAKRGALFMINLKHEVQNRGFIVAHIKTDSIKIPDATPEIIKFVTDYGRRYGYSFEHEATYDRMCLVNNAVYVAKYADEEKCKKLYNYIPSDNQEHPSEWTATGTQFQIPYVFKTLFSKQAIEFKDICETKSVTSALYLDMNENLVDVSFAEKELEKRCKEFKNGVITEEQLQEAKDVLCEEISLGHNYVFVGKIGLFCPIKPGCGGGILVREKDGKYNAATGSKGYRWMEAEMIESLNKRNDVDLSYYNELVTDAVKTIAANGDYEYFVSDDPYVEPAYTKDGTPIYPSEVPFN